MALEVSHILVNIDRFLAVLFKLLHETFDNLCELGEVLLDESLILLVLTFYVNKELLEVMWIIHNQLIDDSLMEIDTRELVRITLNNDCSHSCEMSRHRCCTRFHDEKIFLLDFLKKSRIGFNVGNQRLKSYRNIVGLFHLVWPNKSGCLCSIRILILVVAGSSN